MGTGNAFRFMVRSLPRATAGFALLLGASVLVACGLKEPRRDPTGDLVTYRCPPDDVEFKVYFFAGNPNIRVEIDEQTSELEQVDSDLGIIFSNPEMELIILRDYASLTGSPRGDLMECEDVDQEQFQ